MQNRYADTTWLENGLNGGVSGLVRPLNALDAALVALEDGDTGLNQLHMAYAGELTIADGVITITGSHHTVDTEEDASSDVLHTINGGQEGDVLYLRLANAGRTVTFEHGTGNLYLAGGADYPLTGEQQIVEWFHNGTYWTDICEAKRAPDMVTLQDWTVLESAAASVSISNIASDYPVLILRVEAQSQYSSSYDPLVLRFNDDSSVSHYQGTMEWLLSDTAYTETINKDFGGLYAGMLPTVTGIDDYMNVCQVVIHNIAAGLPKQMHFKGRASFLTAPYMLASIGGGLWLNTTDLINKITLRTYSGNTLGEKSAYGLYGVA